MGGGSLVNLLTWSHWKSRKATDSTLMCFAPWNDREKNKKPNLCEQRGCCFFLGGDVCSCTTFPRFVCFLFLLGSWNGRIKHEHTKNKFLPTHSIHGVLLRPQMPLMDTATRSWTWHLPHNKRDKPTPKDPVKLLNKNLVDDEFVATSHEEKIMSWNPSEEWQKKTIRCSTLTPMVWRVRLAKIHQSGVDKHRRPRMSKTLWIGFVDVQRFPEAQALGKLAAQPHEESKTSAMCLQFVSDRVILCYKIGCSGHFRLLKNWCWCDDVWESLIINSIHRSSDHPWSLLDSAWCLGFFQEPIHIQVGDPSSLQASPWFTS